MIGMDGGGSGARPWAGRRIHLIGVGGSGMSAYARAAYALGAEVSGSDGAAGSYGRRLAADGVLEPAIGHRAENVPAGGDVEVYHSTAVPAENVERAAARARGLPDRPRADLLGELSALRRTIAVAGTHGKTTTASMIARMLLAADMHPGWLIGAPIGGGLANAEWGEGDWLVVEADESDRSMLSLEVEIAVLTNVELDHHASFASLAELREVFRTFLAGPAQAVVWNRPELLALRDGPLVAYDARDVELTEGGSRFRWEDHEVELSVPGVHNAVDAAGALEAVRLAGAPAGEALAALAGFTGAGRRFQPLGTSRRGARLFEDYAHHPTEVRATLRGARTLARRASRGGLPAAPVLAHQAARGGVRRRACGSRCRRRAGDLSGPRARRGLPGRQRPAGRRGGGRRGRRAPRLLAARLRRGPQRARGTARAGRRVRGDGCRGHRAARPRAGGGPGGGRVSAPPEGVLRDQPLARLTTVRTGGRGEFFARAGDLDALLAVVSWAHSQQLELNVVGSGSNLLIADAGVAGLVIKLDGELAAISVETPRVLCGGGARLPAVAARAARAGLSGIEFGVNIPGTLGGAVRMNANAYGGELGAVLDWVELVGPGGLVRRRPEDLGLAYRSSNLRAGEVVARAALLLEAVDREAVAATLAEMRRRRHEAQPQGIKTFGSTFKNPDDPRAGGESAGMLLSRSGCNGLAVGGARFAPKHANFIENTGTATTADVVAVMAEGRRRVLELTGVALEPEVQTLGNVRFPWAFR